MIQREKYVEISGEDDMEIIKNLKSHHPK